MVDYRWVAKICNFGPTTISARVLDMAEWKLNPTKQSLAENGAIEEEEEEEDGKEEKADTNSLGSVESKVKADTEKVSATIFENKSAAYDLHSLKDFVQSSKMLKHNVSFKARAKAGRKSVQPPPLRRLASVESNASASIAVGSTAKQYFARAPNYIPRKCEGKSAGTCLTATCQAASMCPTKVAPSAQTRIS